MLSFEDQTRQANDMMQEFLRCSRRNKAVLKNMNKSTMPGEENTFKRLRSYQLLKVAGWGYSLQGGLWGKCCGYVE